jgi:septum site-determining protein MinC
MKEAVVIKSFPNGIALRLDAELPFDKLLEVIGYKFSEARGFFGNATMALSIEGRRVSDAEELCILDAISENSDLHIICLVGQDGETEKKFVKAISHMENKFAEEEKDGQFYRGSLKNRDVLETENSIIMLGDVHPGSAVISAKNIIVLGGLYGEAYAGGNGREGAFVAALEMLPERIKIGDFKYRPNSKQAKKVLQPKVRPKIAYVKNERIILDTLTKDLLSTF